jgi:hypothetical protein
MTEILQKMEENRDENKKILKQKKSLIIKQISAFLISSNSMSISLIADDMS